MSNKSNTGNRSVDGSEPHHKGDQQKSKQAGATTVSKKGSGKHFKDNSGNEAVRATDPDNTTKKQQNSI